MHSGLLASNIWVNNREPSSNCRAVKKTVVKVLISSPGSSGLHLVYQAIFTVYVLELKENVILKG